MRVSSCCVRDRWGHVVPLPEPIARPPDAALPAGQRFGEQVRALHRVALRLCGAFEASSAASIRPDWRSSRPRFTQAPTESGNAVTSARYSRIAVGALAALLGHQAQIEMQVRLIPAKRDGLRERPLGNAHPIHLERQPAKRDLRLGKARRGSHRALEQIEGLILLATRLVNRAEVEERFQIARVERQHASNPVAASSG
jgi:hypothetical protein